MGRRRNLNGLPNSLVESYLSTLMYYDKGYMACWIWKRASEINITELEIDIINETTTPSEMKTKPIVAYLGQLRDTVTKTLTSNNFDSNFINKAKFKIWISKQDAALRQISCQGVVKISKVEFMKAKYIRKQPTLLLTLFLKKLLKK